MKIKDIKETGFYLSGNPDIIYEVMENTDEEWLKEAPTVTLLVDEWTKEGDNSYYETSGILYRLDTDLASIDVEKTDRKFRVYGSMGQFLEELKEG